MAALAKASNEPEAAAPVWKNTTKVCRELHSKAAEQTKDGATHFCCPRAPLNHNGSKIDQPSVSPKQALRQTSDVRADGRQEAVVNWNSLIVDEKPAREGQLTEAKRPTRLEVLRLQTQSEVYLARSILSEPAAQDEGGLETIWKQRPCIQVIVAGRA